MYLGSLGLGSPVLLLGPHFGKPRSSRGVCKSRSEDSNATLELNMTITLGSFLISLQKGAKSSFYTS